MIQLVTQDQNATAVRIGLTLEIRAPCGLASFLALMQIRLPGLKKSRKDGGVCSEAHSQHQGILLVSLQAVVNPQSAKVMDVTLPCYVPLRPG